MLKEGEAAVVMTSIYSKETCDDEELKKLATVQPLSTYHGIVVNSSRGVVVIWKTSGTT